MGVRNYLIEGLSGTGKTTVAEELQLRGYHVVHGDRSLAYIGDPNTGQPMEQPVDLLPEVAAQWRQERWIWPIDQVSSIASDGTNPVTFFCGGSRNFAQFIHLFTRVFVLDVDLPILVQRLANRAQDEFGRRPEELALIRHLFATKSDIPGQATLIDSSVPVAQVVDTILSHCQPS